ncbi:MAG: hypothetical protein CUN49_05010 [Candidatus Thermofonsia Clade 1 bacterium]|jgi:hypothetical protein|uniref:Uncharacterized protein n=1 Tax=Candidatus Thermofonsia Clade 1 bacterium TaxID=2364210 RepID=A0A2M8PG60_9CHLR|nr:MAG: hypothetical protein CUN49_05010 [Candidatus Thermofonsia Clade 1 bacterium]RMF52514.1 MAG: hypothetical protein D6749_04785 [Chloroflexota bacterium]
MAERSSGDNIDDIRGRLMEDDLFESFDDVPGPAVQRVEQKRIFGLTAGERMILSIIFFIAVSVLSIALLLVTNTIAIP